MALRRNRLWGAINYSSVLSTIALIISSISLLFAGISLYYTNFYRHRAILPAIAPKPALSAFVKARSDADLPFTWSPIISNDGNRTEIVLSVCIAIGYSGPATNSTHQIRGPLAGPFVLKAGDAVAVPITFNFDKMVSLPKEDDVYVRVVALSPSDGIIAVDIPVLHITMASQIPSEVELSEKPSAGYNDSLIDIFSSPKSAFSYSGPGLSETQTQLTITVSPQPK